MFDEKVKVLLFLAQGFEALEVAFLLMECLIGPEMTQEVRNYRIYKRNT